MILSGTRGPLHLELGPDKGDCLIPFGGGDKLLLVDDDEDEQTGIRRGSEDVELLFGQGLSKLVTRSSSSVCAR